MFEMLPIRRGFYDLFEPIERQFDIFPEFFGASAIRADLQETYTHYIITAEMPGVNKENIKIDYDGSILRIEAFRVEESETRTGTYIRKERQEGSFSRSWLIKNIIRDGIQAELKDGILIVKMKKDKEGLTQVEIK